MDEGRSRKEWRALTKPSPEAASAAESLRTPRERIDDAVQELEGALEAELLERVRGMSSAEFEGLILRLLLAMGYGQGLEEMALALGGSGDGGDGRRNPSRPARA